jgi:type I restriction enzyme M protein
LLLRVKREVKDVDMIYGQEMNRTTYNLARMNMILHDVHFAKFDIKQEDTLTRPQHIDQRFEAVVANPPFSAKWSADPISYKMNVSAVLVTCAKLKSRYGFCSAHASSIG